ncbi:hypothetical protein Hanom_Chr11g00993421 [Helianthus anomalus]
MNGDSVVLYQGICWQIAGNLFAVCKLINLPSKPFSPGQAGTKGSSSHRLARTSSCLECWQQVMCFSIFLTFRATKYNRYVIHISRLASSKCLLSSVMY